MSNQDFILLLKEYLSKLESLEGGRQTPSEIVRVIKGRKKYPFDIMKMKKVSKNLLENTLKITKDNDTIKLIKYALSNYEANKEGLYNMVKIKKAFKKEVEVKPEPEVKPEVKPEIKPEIKPKVKQISARQASKSLKAKNKREQEKEISDAYQKVIDESKRQDKEREETHEEMITRHKKEGVYREFTKEEEDELYTLNKKYKNSKSEKNKVELSKRINILNNKRAESNQYKQNILYPEMEARADEARGRRMKKKEVVENPDIISGKLQQLLFITPINKIKEALIKLNFKGKLQTNKILLVQQLLQNFITVEMMKKLISAIDPTLTGSGFFDWVSDKATDAYNYVKQKVSDVKQEIADKGSAVLTRTNYVGPFNRLDDEYLRTHPPVDIIDEGAMKHDLEYSRIAKLRDDGKIGKEETDKLIRDSDIAFLDNIRKHWKVNPWASALGYAGIRNKNLLEDYADLDKNLFVGQGKSYPLHAVIFKKPYDLETAKKEAKKIINDDKKNFYRETETSFRFRAIPKTKFEKKSFRTKKVNNNISLIFGKLK